MSKKLMLTLSAVSLIFGVGCLGGGDDDGDGSSGTPAVTMTCSASTDCGDDSANGKVFYFAIVPQGYNCATFDFGSGTTGYLSYVNGPVACSGGTCAGSSSATFLNSDTDAAVATPDAGSYSIFFFIDTDGDEGPTNDEPGACSDGLTWDGTSYSLTISADLSGF